MKNDGRASCGNRICDWKIRETEIFSDQPHTSHNLYYVKWIKECRIKAVHAVPRKILAFYEIMAAKMRHAKLHDLFDAIKDRPSRPWHARLAMHAIM